MIAHDLSLLFVLESFSIMHISVNIAIRGLLFEW
jgi:hypothetical protein